MITRYFIATAAVSLEKMTPVIEALFGAFNLQSGRPDVSASAQARIPTWTDILGRLRTLSETLSLDASDGALDTVQSALLLFAAHFRCVDDPALAELLELHRFDGEADVETLFVIAKRFDDGHGLKVIKFTASDYEGDPAHSANRLANETLDLVVDLMPLIVDKAQRAALRRRIAALLVDAGERMSPLTATLNDGTVVLAKPYKGSPTALTYANRSQAKRAAERVDGEVIGRRPFYVRMPESKR